MVLKHASVNSCLQFCFVCLRFFFGFKQINYDKKMVGTQNKIVGMEPIEWNKDGSISCHIYVYNFVCHTKSCVTRFCRHVGQGVQLDFSRLFVLKFSITSIVWTTARLLLTLLHRLVCNLFCVRTCSGSKNAVCRTWPLLTHLQSKLAMQKPFRINLCWPCWPPSKCATPLHVCCYLVLHSFAT